jgi:hypothetical protein
MSNLIAIAYPDVATATRVRDRLLELQRERLIILADAPFGGEIVQTSRARRRRPTCGRPSAMSRPSPNSSASISIPDRPAREAS